MAEQLQREMGAASREPDLSPAPASYSQQQLIGGDSPPRRPPDTSSMREDVKRLDSGAQDAEIMRKVMADSLADHQRKPGIPNVGRGSLSLDEQAKFNEELKKAMMESMKDK